jgi:glycerol kinase
VTDVSNASRTMLMDLRTLDWDDEMLAVMGVPRPMLPTILSLGEVYGVATGDLAGVPIGGDLGDQQAALFGQTCFAPGEAKNTYGTGCFMLLNTGTAPVVSKAGLLTTLGYRIGTEPAIYALEGSIAIAGALVQWLRDNLGLIRDSAEVETLARPDYPDAQHVRLELHQQLRRSRRPRPSAPPMRPGWRSGSGTRSTTCEPTGPTTSSGNRRWIQSGGLPNTHAGRRP